MNTYHLKQKWNQGILGYPTAEEIDFLFAEVERLEGALAGAEKLLREEKEKVLTMKLHGATLPKKGGDTHGEENANFVEG